MILDVGPATVAALIGQLARLKTLVWNGPLGAFETPPFDAATTAFAKAVAAATAKRRAAQRRRRRRHRLGAAPRRRAGQDELRLDRRRCVPGVAGRQDAARGRRVGVSGENWIGDHAGGLYERLRHRHIDLERAAGRVASPAGRGRAASTIRSIGRTSSRRSRVWAASNCTRCNRCCGRL